jgi:hypothetical protein
VVAFSCCIWFLYLRCLALCFFSLNVLKAKSFIWSLVYCNLCSITLWVWTLFLQLCNVFGIDSIFLFLLVRLYRVMLHNVARPTSASDGQVMWLCTVEEISYKNIRNIPLLHSLCTFIMWHLCNVDLQTTSSYM